MGQKISSPGGMTKQNDYLLKLQCSRKTFMVHQTFVRWNWYIPFKCEISHQIFRPSHRKCPTCLMIFSWKLELKYCWGGGWGCEVSCGGHHGPKGKTTTGSALEGAVFDIAQILAHLVHNMSRSQLYLGFGHFGWLPFFSVNNIWRAYG